MMSLFTKLIHKTHTRNTCNQQTQDDDVEGVRRVEVYCHSNRDLNTRAAPAAHQLHQLHARSFAYLLLGVLPQVILSNHTVLCQLLIVQVDMLAQLRKGTALKKAPTKAPAPAAEPEKKSGGMFDLNNMHGLDQKQPNGGSSGSGSDSSDEDWDD
jgi:hypothetical protein